MASVLSFSPSSMQWKSKHLPSTSHSVKGTRFGGFRARAFFNPIEDPVVKEALKEPVAFVSGMFAGFLRLDLNEDPLREWLTRTVEASGITVEEIEKEGRNPEEDVPQEIEIE